MVGTLISQGRLTPGQTGGILQDNGVRLVPTPVSLCDIGIKSAKGIHSLIPGTLMQSGFRLVTLIHGRQVSRRRHEPWRAFRRNSGRHRPVVVSEVVPAPSNLL